MDTIRPSVPASVPMPAGGPTFSGDVSATTVSEGSSSALESQPDARSNPNSTGAIPVTPAATGAAGTQAATPGAGTPPAGASAQEPLPMNATYQPKGKPKKQKKQKKTQQQAAPAQAAQPQSQQGTPPTQKQ